MFLHKTVQSLCPVGILRGSGTKITLQQKWGHRTPPPRPGAQRPAGNPGAVPAPWGAQPGQRQIPNRATACGVKIPAGKPRILPERPRAGGAGDAGRAEPRSCDGSRWIPTDPDGSRRVWSGAGSHQLVQEGPDAGSGLPRPRHGFVAHGAHAAHLQPLHQAPAGRKAGMPIPAGNSPLPPRSASPTHFLWKACWHGSTPSSSFTRKSSRQTAQVCCGR